MTTKPAAVHNLVLTWLCCPWWGTSLLQPPSNHFEPPSKRASKPLQPPTRRFSPHPPACRLLLSESALLMSRATALSSCLKSKLCWYPCLQLESILPWWRGTFQVQATSKMPAHIVLCIRAWHVSCGKPTSVHFWWSKFDTPSDSWCGNPVVIHVEVCHGHKNW